MNEPHELHLPDCFSRPDWLQAVVRVPPFQRWAPPPLRHPEDGFSLVELLVTVALMIVIFVLLFGFSSKSHQQKQKVECERNLANIYVALEMFANEHSGLFPDRTNAQTSDVPLSQLMPQYTSTSEPFICPGSKDKKLPEGESIYERRISYSYCMGLSAGDAAAILMSDEQVDAQQKVKGLPVFSITGKRPGNNHYKYGGNFLFADGRTESSGAVAQFSLILTQGVVLLNPKEP
jgi:prepilin-type processing-associated H-X9-DG protein